jgi:hypothetical protein
MLTTRKSFLVLALTAALAACGGGGGGGGGGGSGSGSGSGNDPNVNPGTGDQSTLLPCINTATNLCSGRFVQSENSVTMTDAGVQVYGISTSDLDTTPKTTEENVQSDLVAWGLAPSDPSLNGMAEVRLQKDGNGTITRTGLMLANIGLMWDNRTQRPPVIEIFTDRQGYPTQGRVSLVPNDPQQLIQLGPLPPSNNLDFYDWAEKGTAGTQAHYANNVYFPRSEKIRCDGNPGCPEDYAWYADKQRPVFDDDPGDWTNIGAAGLNLREAADEYRIMRFHEDGDLRAGDAKPGPNGERRYIDDSGDNSGFGVSFPGFKGYRALNNYSYQYANLASWTTLDTVDIVEWSLGTNEHNALRRGFVAFGNVSSPASITSANNSVTYRGAVYGFYAPTTIAQPKRDDPDYPQKYQTDEDAQHFRGVAEVTVNFNTGTATISFIDPRTFNAASEAVPAALTVTAALGGTNNNSGPRNYFTASLDSATDTRRGGISGRFYGPASNGIPPEIAGALSFTLNTGSPTAQQTVIAGFLARRP